MVVTLKCDVTQSSDSFKKQVLVIHRLWRDGTFRIKLGTKRLSASINTLYSRENVPEIINMSDISYSDSHPLMEHGVSEEEQDAFPSFSAGFPIEIPFQNCVSDW